MLAAMLSLIAASIGVETPCELSTVNRAVTSSSQCVSCHDGSAATHVTWGADRRSHPIGMRYADVWVQSRAGLNGIIPRALVLVEGRVECTTCHDGASLEPHRVAVPLRSICTDCHGRK